MDRLALQGRYKRYKQGIAQLLTWLANAASSDAQLPGAGHDSPHTAPDFRTRQYWQERGATLNTQDLVPMATTIVAYSDLNIPRAMLNLARETMASREKYAAFYASFPTPANSQHSRDNATHQFFNDTLKAVLQTLLAVDPVRIVEKPFKPTVTKSEGNVKSPQNCKLRNLFALLDDEEPSESSTSPPSSVKTRQSRQPDAERASRASDKVAKDTAFALWCLLEDLNDIRTYVRNAWRDYVRGDLSLLAVGTLTNAAFGLMKQACDELTTRYPQFESYPDVQKFLQLDVARVDGLVVPLPSSSQQSASMPGCHKADHIRLLCTTGAEYLLAVFESQSHLDQILRRKTRHELKTYMSAVGMLPMSTGDSSELCIEAARECDEMFPEIMDRTWALKTHAYQSLTGSVTMHGFLRRLLRMTPIVSTPGRKVRQDSSMDFMLKDVFTAGLTELMSLDTEGQIPLWLAAACQTYAEIHEVLRGNMECGANAFLANVIAGQDQAAQCEAVRKELGDDSKAKIWADFIHVINLFKTGGLSREDAANARDWGKDNPGMFNPTNFDLPVLACDFWMRNKRFMYTTQVGLANGSLSVLCMAHIYHACQRYGVLPRWQDMEFVLADNPTFAAKPNANADAYAIAR